MGVRLHPCSLPHLCPFHPLHLCFFNLIQTPLPFNHLVSPRLHHLPHKLHPLPWTPIPLLLCYPPLPLTQFLCPPPSQNLTLIPPLHHHLLAHPSNLHQPHPQNSMQSSTEKWALATCWMILWVFSITNRYISLLNFVSLTSLILARYYALFCFR